MEASMCRKLQGEYVVSVFQDLNSNEILDENFFGIPSEPIGKTNYGLRGAPGSFNKLKTPVNKGSVKLIVNMGKVKALGVIWKITYIVFFLF